MYHHVHFPYRNLQNERFIGFGWLPFLTGGVLGLAAAPFFYRPYYYPPPYPVPYPAPYQQPYYPYSQYYGTNPYIGTENINIYTN
ncbi:hypothetical protein J9303_15490 [Bacillaceae bacterium Marseille-Q3522]|nr:hypothetical protein [Bacillaceae bacterium Marseille-Q3522]